MAGRAISDETPRIESALEQHNVALQWIGMIAGQSELTASTNDR